jgi:hypothetical protein
MQNQLNRQLTVYLSKSLLIPETRLKVVRDILISYNFKILEYQEGTTYTTQLISSADFVLFITDENPIKMETLNNGLWSTYCGKGQYSEAEFCYKNHKPAFMFMSYKDEKILMSKLVDRDFSSMLVPYTISDVNDWKRKYGKIRSYVRGQEPVDLYGFLEGHFRLLRQYPVTPDECFSREYLLLLLD